MPQLLFHIKSKVVPDLAKAVFASASVVTLVVLPVDVELAAVVGAAVTGDEVEVCAVELAGKTFA